MAFFFARAANADTINFGHEIAEGGISILIIIALSVIALAVSIERFIHLRAIYIIPHDLLQKVRPLWIRKEYVALQELLATENSTLARIIQYLIRHRKQNYSTVSIGAGELASIELRYHQQKAYALAIVATVAPIVGLLGTVIGMIEAFHVIAFSEGMGNPALLAGGISKALINTASGLSVALPALVMHHFLKNRSAFLSLSLEKTTNELLNEWFMPADQNTEPTTLEIVHHAY